MPPTRSFETQTRVTGAASLFLIAIGTVVLAGWVFDTPFLKGLFGDITMKANAALGLLASGWALRLRTMPRPAARLAGRACAVFAGVLGALTLSEHIVGWDLGIDELLFTETPGARATVSPGRMGPNASASLTLAGIALWRLYRHDKRSAAIAQVLGALMAVLALVPVVGYWYGAAELYAVARFTGIAFHTGVALLVLAVGILAARSDVGPVSALTLDAPHAVMARRLLATSIVVPLSLGYLRILGERSGWYDTGFGVSIVVVGMIVLLSVTIWRTALANARIERERVEIERHRDDLLLSERAARQQAERADRAKDEFIAALSHELRTPLNAILGWMQMLQQRVVSEAGREKATDAVNRNAGVLARLIEDLLDTSRITTGHLELSKDPVDMNAVARAAAESVLPAADARQVTVTVVPAVEPPVVIGDAQRLQQVVWNLLSNAIKFSPTGGAVRVEVAASADGVTVRVRDQGKGIDPLFLPQVFDRFKRDHADSSYGTGGLGLGLYIAKHLAELHRGSISAESEGIDRGAVFTIHLPASAEAVAAVGSSNIARGIL